MKPSARFIKTGWHLLLVAAALGEIATSESDLRKLLLGVCAGWHVAAAWSDWRETKAPAASFSDDERGHYHWPDGRRYYKP